MAYQLPAMALQQWRAPKPTGISLNYVPQVQQIGSPQNAINLAKWMMPQAFQPPPAPVAPAAPLVDPRRLKKGEFLYDGGSGRSNQGYGGEGFGGSRSTGYGGYGGSGTRAGGVSIGGRGLW